jgi:hypothetical protein
LSITYSAFPDLGYALSFKLLAAVAVQPKDRFDLGVQERAIPAKNAAAAAKDWLLERWHNPKETNDFLACYRA